MTQVNLADRRRGETTSSRSDRRRVVRLIPAVPDHPAPPRIADLLLGPARGMLEVLAAPHGIDGVLGGVTLWDPLAGRCCATDDLLLVAAPSTGTTSAVRAIAEAARGGACAVVLKGIEDVAAVRDRARRSGVTVLVAADRVSWDDLCVLARSLAPAARLGQVAAPRPSADLFGLAEATAAAAGGPVEIVDAELQTLAYAGLGHPVDALRERSVLDRRAPDAAREWFTTSGTAQRLREGREPLEVHFPGAVSRIMAPVVVRDAVVGYVVVAEGTVPLGEAAVGVLAEAASVVAARLISVPEIVPAGPGDVADLLLRGALAGTGSLAELGAATAWTLLALRAVDAVPDPGAGRSAGACVRMVFPGAAVVQQDVTHFVLLPGWRGREVAHGAAEAVRERLTALYRVRFVACVSGSVAAGDDVAALARPLGRAAALLAAANERPAVAALADLRPWAVLAELGEIARDRPSLLDGALNAVLDQDPERRTEALTSLLAWFDAGGDISESARRLQVHRNTLRYRLQRIEARCGISLDDPVQRFTVELQVRLLTLGLAEHWGPGTPADSQLRRTHPGAADGGSTKGITKPGFIAHVPG